MSLPRLLVFDLDACLWHPEMYELDGAPSSYSAAKGGVLAGRDVVELFPGAATVLRKVLVDERFAGVKVAVASSTTEPAWANRCIELLPIDPAGQRAERMADLIDYRQIYPGSKGRQHFPALLAQSGVGYDQMCFWDDCSYGDNCAEVALRCAGVTCVRTPEGLTDELFEAGLDAFARGERGVVGGVPVH